jgi:Uracil DNA glycosylase superfamily
MEPASGNSITILVEGREVRTLRDILPASPGLHVLFVAKTPAPASVEEGHYFQGRQGRMFSNRLKNYDLLKRGTGFEDDSLLEHGCGLTDIVKEPHEFGDESSSREYLDGLYRILELVRVHHPTVVVFVYKKVLGEIARLGFGVKKKSDYGFNVSLETHFGTRVFVFPLPGTPCTKGKAVSAMRELKIACGRRSSA